MTKLFTWATVTATSPLRITIDGDTTALPFVPDSLVDPLTLMVADRVRVELSNARAIIHGRAGGFSSQRTSKIINGSFRTNQREYVSAASLPIGAYGFDRWKASGVVNLALNPTAAAATTFWSGSGATISRLTGLTIPGLPGVTTAIRGTMAAVTGGLYDVSDATAPYSLVTPGVTYRISAWLRASAAKTIQPSAQFYNASGTNIGSVNAAATVSLAANTWTFVTWTGIAPVGAARLGPYWYSTAAWAAGNTLDVTGVMITQGAVTYPYFDGSMTDCSWAGTANASASYNVPNVVPTLTYTSDPHGQQITLNAGARVSQIIERANMPADTYVFAHDGTAQIRVYNNKLPPGSRPAFATGPVTAAIDGTDHVVVEFSGGGAGATIANVRAYSGTTDFGWSAPSIADEMARCLRYYYRLSNPSTSGGTIAFLTSSAYTASTHFGIWRFPAVMRIAPTPAASGAAAFLVQYAGAATVSTVITFNHTDPAVCRVDVTGAGAVTPGYSSWLELEPGFYVEAEAEIH